MLKLMMYRIRAMHPGWLLLALLLAACSVSAADSIDVERIAAELPPGFDIQGPNDYWSCHGSDNARAAFFVATPDELRLERQRAVEQGTKNTKDDLLAVEEQAWEDGDEETLAAVRDSMDLFDEVMVPFTQELVRRFGEMDMREDTMLEASFTGTHEGRDCLLFITADLPAPGAQIVEDFSVGVMRAQRIAAYKAVSLSADIPALKPMAALEQALAGIKKDPELWDRCHGDDCPASLVLEHAEMNHISGSFRFTLERYVHNGQPVDSCPTSEGGCSWERRTVTGFFNATSKMEEGDLPIVRGSNRMFGMWFGHPPGPSDSALPGGSFFGPGREFSERKKMNSPIEIERNQN